MIRRAALLILIASAACVFAGDSQPLELPGIHNAFRVTDRLISGSQPEGDAAFAELARRGVKTIVSVDGAKPDVATARKFGLRYVHLPFGYDGIPEERVAQLARAVSTTTSGIFVHCHHGKHRGPAAVAVMCEATAGWTASRAEAWLREAGTGAEYPGLYRAARDFRPPTADALARVGELPESTKTADLVDVMVSMDEQLDVLKAAQNSGWNPPPAAPATLLWEHLRELARTDDTAKRTDEYRAKLSDAEHAASAFAGALREPERARRALDAAFTKTTESCAACHKAHRNERQER